MYANRDLELIYFVQNNCICTSQGFVTKCFLIFIVDKVKNFTVNNNHLSYWSQSQIEDLCNKGKKATTISSSIGYWRKCSTVGWYFRIDQGNGKIPQTCNLLIIDQWILRSGDLKFIWWGFSIVRGFLYLSTNHRVNLISTAFSVFGDLLVPPQFTCKLT